MTGPLEELQPLVDELHEPNLTEARWRELLKDAEPIVERIGEFEFIEPFLIIGSNNGWKRNESARAT